MNTTVTPPASLPLVATDEEQDIRDSVRGICARFGERYARACYDAGKPPRELWQALAEKGFVGANLPERWGGGGMGLSALSAIAEEVAATGNSAIMLVLTSGIAGEILVRHGSDEQNDRWLRGIAAGTTKFAFGITEPDAGTNTHNLRTEVRRNGRGYRLRGQKTFISGVEDADAVLVVARFRRDDGELGKPCLCIVDVDAPGFTRNVVPMPYMGPDRQWTLFFDDVNLAPDRLVGGEEGGLASVFDGLNPERILVAAHINGKGRLALERGAAYARERVVWDKPIGTHQAVAHPLAKAKIELELARLMTQRAAALFDANAPGVGEAANMAKYAAAEAAIHSVDAAIQTHGGNGLALEYGLSDMWWSVRVSRTAPVSAEMILNYVAQHSLGLPRSY
jgi:alkylation response protein AidB-like acyl-CoA dehydrogenase